MDHQPDIECNIEPQVLRTVKRSMHQLPGMSGAVQSTLSLLSDQTTNVKTVAQAVEKDQVLAARVLRLVNSPFFGLERQITSIRQAVILLGFNTIRQLVLSFGINRTITELSRKYEFDMEQFWNHSISTAVLGRRIANTIPGSDTESAFASGLLHDIGKLVLYMAFGDQYHKIQREAHTVSIDLCAVEKEKLGITHPQAGFILGQKWNFPEPILKCILFHHSVPPFTNTGNFIKVIGEEYYNLVEICSLSNVLSSWLGYGLRAINFGDLNWNGITIGIHMPEYVPPRDEPMAFLKQEVDEVLNSFNK
ncbi:HDOD domain-containing protein [Myxococcota bacterium]|nr:HDOD domain-containing protein [Myxococcota bacterium]MBU1381558.1 HDOD domain-containing protein [Myxococcota bacterium]MBU1495440.1 HDOD domain-containing protein [Myxococcota bacterium]